MKKKVDKILEIFLVFLMSVLVIDVLWQVASRYVFKNPSSFTDEIAGFLLIWVGLAGAAYATGANKHLAIDLLHTKLGPATKKKVEIIIHLVVIFFALTVLIIGGTWLVLSRFNLGQVSASLEIPIGYVYLILPLSGLLIVYYSVYFIQKILKP
jgi:TRAP-type C4-dicarboxylate transport system permease small subunit